MRLKFCRDNMAWSNEWKRVAFSDEKKKFNLEGPDGYNYYFHDLRKETHQLDRLHSRVGGVMVWGAISYYGTCELQFLGSSMNAKAYQGVLEKAFLSFENLFGPLPWTFQQDNAPIHTARLVKSWIESKNFTLLNSPPYSPDLNIIEFGDGCPEEFTSLENNFQLNPNLLKLFNERGLQFLSLI